MHKNKWMTHNSWEMKELIYYWNSQEGGYCANVGAVEGENQALGPNLQNNFIWVPLPSVKKQYNFYNVIHINYSSWVLWQFFFGYFEAAISIALSSIFLLPQANGHACVDFGRTHPIDGLFWSLPIYLLGFFSKYECCATNLIRLLHHFYFLGCHFPFCIARFHITMKCRNQFIWLIGLSGPWVLLVVGTNDQYKKHSTTTKWWGRDEKWEWEEGMEVAMSNHTKILDEEKLKNMPVWLSK